MEDKYYKNIKELLIDNEITKRVKDYSKNKSDLETYYNVGKMLSEAGKHYGEGIIKKYSNKLTNELGKGYLTRTLKYMRAFYNFQKRQPLAADLTWRQFYNYFSNSKVSPLVTQLSWTHYLLLLPIKDINKIEYYMNLCISYNLSKRQLEKRIKSNEYERLPEDTKLKLINRNEIDIKDSIPEPIIIKSNMLIDKEKISEKVLHKII